MSAAAGDIVTETALREWLERAACWRFASLLLETPSDRALAELRASTAELPARVRDSAVALLPPDRESWDQEFHATLGPAGVPACESSYDPSAIAGRGPLVAQVAGFYEAFAFTPDPRASEVPDHVSVQLAFLGYLALKVAFALHERAVERAEVTREAYLRFQEEHVAFWIHAFGERLDRIDSGQYAGRLAWITQLVES